MIINKYNSAKAKGLTRAGISTGAISSVSTSSTSVVGGGDLDRELWGQKDEGGDIDGSMWVNGSLYLGAIDYGSEDDEEAVDDSYVDNAETGSLIAEALVQSRDMYCKEHPYITYPIVNGQKTDLRELFNGFDERIQNNTGEINKLKAKVTTNTTNITSSIAEIQNLDTRVTTLEGQIGSSANLEEIKTNIANNSSEITKLKARVTNLENNGGGSGGITDSMPIGSIIMYNGKAEDIPKGWAICDGMLGTPNLVDRFVLGSFSAGGTGGASQITLTAEQLPKHSHKVNAWYGKSGSTGSGNGLQSSPVGQQVSTEETGNNEAINIMPPYYRLIYIMKVGTTTDTTQTT